MLQDNYETVDLLAIWKSKKKNRKENVPGNILRTFDNAVENCKIITIDSHEFPATVSYVFDSTHCKKKNYYQLEHFIFKGRELELLSTEQYFDKVKKYTEN